jgi:hypothetical protein
MFLWICALVTILVGSAHGALADCMNFKCPQRANPGCGWTIFYSTGGQKNFTSDKGSNICDCSVRVGDEYCDTEDGQQPRNDCSRSRVTSTTPRCP